MGERYENIDYTKGLAVTLVVVMHAFACAGYLYRAGGGSIEGFGPMAVFAEMMYGGLFLFLFISGYFYRPGRSYRENVMKRARQIVPPFVVLAIATPVIMYGLLCLEGYALDPANTVAEIVRTLLGSAFCTSIGITVDQYTYAFDSLNGPFYFLQMLLGSLLIFYAIADDASKDRGHLAIWIVILISASFVLKLSGAFLPFYLHLAPAAAVFEILGMYAARHNMFGRLRDDWKTAKYWLGFAAVIAASAVLAYLFPTGCQFDKSLYGSYGAASVPVFFLLEGACVLFTAYLGSVLHKIPVQSKLFVTVGHYSLYVLLLHYFLLKVMCSLMVTVEIPMEIEMPFESVWQILIAILLAVVVSVAVGYVVERVKTRNADAGTSAL